MSVIISIETPGKTRHHHRRTIAEALRWLSRKPRLDDEAKNLAALIVFCLHDIAGTVDQAIVAWGKRDFWIKAERFREEWCWLEPTADELSVVIYEGRWDELSVVLACLIPRFADIRIRRMVREPALWEGAYEEFMGLFFNPSLPRRPPSLDTGITTPGGIQATTALR